MTIALQSLQKPISVAHGTTVRQPQRMQKLSNRPISQQGFQQTLAGRQQVMSIAGHGGFNGSKAVTALEETHAKLPY